jgi:hypothetical protein
VDLSRGSDVPWPARSPDLSACDYFLWGYLKSRVFISKPRVKAEQKQSIKGEIAAILGQMTRRVMQNLGLRLNQCLRNGGRHLSEVFSNLKMVSTEFSSDNNFYMKRYIILKTFRFFCRTLYINTEFVQAVSHLLAMRFVVIYPKIKFGERTKFLHCTNSPFTADNFPF